MTTENFAIFFFLAGMGTRKRVHAFVRVKPTDDFAHEMIKYGGDNKVSTVCLPSPAWASLCPSSLQPLRFPSNLLRTKTELVEVQMESRVIQGQSTPPQCC